MTAKLVYPSASRNGAPIFECLGKWLPDCGRVLEIASGSGQHISGLANRHPAIVWQPSDPEPEARASINAWAGDENGGNLLPALDIDVMAARWWHGIDDELDVMMAINMLHIAPWQAALGLLQGAGALLKSGGFLYLYGPYKIDGESWALSNAAFDASLRARNRLWGIRSKTDIAKAAVAHGLMLSEVIAMPANNFSLILRKQ